MTSLQNLQKNVGIEPRDQRKFLGTLPNDWAGFPFLGHHRGCCSFHVLCKAKVEQPIRNRQWNTSQFSRCFWRAPKLAKGSIYFLIMDAGIGSLKLLKFLPWPLQILSPGMLWTSEVGGRVSLKNPIRNQQHKKSTTSQAWSRKGANQAQVKGHTWPHHHLSHHICELFQFGWAWMESGRLGRFAVFGWGRVVFSKSRSKSQTTIY